MISRENFAFTIGFEGNKAIVDAKAKRAYGKMDARALAEAGQYRAAFAWSLYGGVEAEIRDFIDRYRALTGSTLETVEDYSRLFGVTLIEIDEAMEVG
jgi:hypothetical protein